jgi:hypothetical protein
MVPKSTSVALRVGVHEPGVIVPLTPMTTLVAAAALKAANDIAVHSAIAEIFHFMFIVSNILTDKLLWLNKKCRNKLCSNIAIKKA